MFNATGYATIWKIELKDKHAEATLGTGRKEKRGQSSRLVGREDSKGNYWVNSNWSFVRFVGRAFEKIAEASERDRINVTEASFTLEPYFDKDGQKQYPKSARLTVFDFEFVDSGGSVPLTSNKDDGDDIPF